MQINQNSYATKTCNPRYVYNMDEMAEFNSKIKDIFSNSKVYLGGSVATYLNLPDILRMNYSTEGHDIDYFVIGKNMPTCVLCPLMLSYANCAVVPKPGNPEYYKMPGILKVFHFHSGDLNRKINIIMLNDAVYTNDPKDLFLVMGHSLAKCVFTIGFGGSHSTLVSTEFTKSLKHSQIRVNHDLLNNKAKQKIISRANRLNMQIV